MKIIYVEQFDGWWRLTPDEWRKLCEGGAKGKGHELPANRMLKSRPSKVGVQSLLKRSYFPKTNDIVIYSPLDWEESDYESALNDLDEMEAKAT